jgi:hypothetical protein
MQTGMYLDEARTEPDSSFSGFPVNPVALLFFSFFLSPFSAAARVLSFVLPRCSMCALAILMAQPA